MSEVGVDPLSAVQPRCENLGGALHHHSHDDQHRSSVFPHFFTNTSMKARKKLVTPLYAVAEDLTDVVRTTESSPSSTANCIVRGFRPDDCCLSTFFPAKTLARITSTTGSLARLKFTTSQSWLVTIS